MVDSYPDPRSTVIASAHPVGDQNPGFGLLVGCHRVLEIEDDSIGSLGDSLAESFRAISRYVQPTANYHLISVWPEVRDLAMIIFMMSFVPSPILIKIESRYKRSTTYSVEYPYPP